MLLLFILTLVAVDSPMAQEEVKIGYLTLVMSLPTFVALEKGYFQEQGLKVVNTPFESGTLIVDALVTGRIDVNAGSAVVLTGSLNRICPAPLRFLLFMVPYNRKITRSFWRWQRIHP